MKQIRKVELLVGSFILIGSCAILLMFVQLANFTGIDSKDVYTLKAKFENIGNLKVRSPVKVSGVVVGRVADIYLDVNTLIPVVSMEINSQYNQFSDTSSLRILTSGLIGDQYIGLFPGFLFDGQKTLVDGDLIEDTNSALVLEDLISHFLYSIEKEK
ncbi:phospholipid ABC transporter-binding protein [Candidatus Photodesmus katoptron]|uniref:Mce related protein n=1 Tax=Candidatus Photodesmus katoptron Akat1 TaxID=1236703 RepID=S3EGF5_9GAMM|nr:outer membrane lipid asymmetry maintenance protein MlaD [Candidatus Photodesmus katoptron]EPE37248.1 mce related protein [Candidatus Photodesmus katoptron Akat1]KEY90095.1 phospholipid ABC transporter-binding protein [Candidatus Photodesmus katoptron]